MYSGQESYQIILTDRDSNLRLSTILRYEKVETCNLFKKTGRISKSHTRRKIK